MVAPCAASPAMSCPAGTGVRPGCRVMITVCEMPGDVSSVGSAAAAATKELTPGTTAYVDPRRVQGAHLLADRAVEARVAGVQAHDAACRPRAPRPSTSTCSPSVIAALSWQLAAVARPA